MNAHCIVCGKEYIKWGWLSYHFKTRHPDSNVLIRTYEMMDAMNEEAKIVSEMGLHVWDL